jgi:hypothetical protein
MMLDGIAPGVVRWIVSRTAEIGKLDEMIQRRHDVGSVVSLLALTVVLTCKKSDVVEVALGTY